MEFYIVSSDFEILGIVDTYKSAIWTERYYESGDFELYVPATEDMLELLQKHRFVVRADDRTKCMIIESIKISTDADDGNYITVSGRSLSSILSRRIVWKQTTFSGQLEQVIRRIIEKNCICPDDSDRELTGLTLGDAVGITTSVSAQYTGDNVETAISELCRANGIGYDVALDLDNAAMVFYLYQGEDRSYNQSVNPYVVFSPNFENLLASDYTNSDADYANVAQVAGEGEGVARSKQTVGTAAGLERFEIFVNASSVSTNTSALDAITYANLLVQEGTEALAERATSESMESEVAPNYNFVLNEDYYLGDVVEVINEYGIAMTPRVVEVIECQDETGYSCIPTFATD